MGVRWPIVGFGDPNPNVLRRIHYILSGESHDPRIKVELVWGRS